MARVIGTGTVLVKNAATLPKELRLESEPYAAGWKIMGDLDGHGLDRALQKAGWTLFRPAGEVKISVFGIDNQSMLRRAVERLLARGQSDGFNCLEITQIASVGSERFPLVCYATVSAQWRHIQESPLPGRDRDIPDLERESASISQSTGIASDKAPLSRQQPERADAASIVNP
ncbi:MAG TPA: hypothetical protein VNJ52_12880 [Patescibacteria group bacterium]|nr:hypothetical protein [Patescibacteria group bacterium]